VWTSSNPLPTNTESSRPCTLPLSELTREKPRYSSHIHNLLHAIADNADPIKQKRLLHWHERKQEFYDRWDIALGSLRKYIIPKSISIFTEKFANNLQ